MDFPDFDYPFPAENLIHQPFDSPAETEGTSSTMINYGDIDPAAFYPWDQYAENTQFSQVSPTETDGTFSTMIYYGDIAPATFYPWDQNAEYAPFSQEFQPPLVFPGNSSDISINSSSENTEILPTQSENTMCASILHEMLPSMQEPLPTLGFLGSTDNSNINSSIDNIEISSTQSDCTEWASIANALLPILQELLPTLEFLGSTDNSNINSSFGNIEISSTQSDSTEWASIANALLPTMQIPLNENYIIQPSETILNHCPSDCLLHKTKDFQNKVLKRKYKNKKREDKKRENKKKWICIMCGHKAGSIPLLYRHIRSLHIPRECPYCGFKASRRYLNLEKHIVMDHPQFIDVMCTTSEFNAHFSYTIGHYLCYFNEK